MVKCIVTNRSTLRSVNEATRIIFQCHYIEFAAGCRHGLAVVSLFALTGAAVGNAEGRWAGRAGL